MVLVLFLALSGGGDVEEITQTYQLVWTEDAATGRHLLKSDRFSLAFVPGLQVVIVNGVPERLPVPPVIEGGRVRFPPELVARIARSCPTRDLAKADPPVIVPPLTKTPIPVPKAKPQLPPCVIAIDAGHGGIHTGFKGHTGLLEKDINLDVACELERILTSWGAKVVMTRTDDSHFSTDINDDLMARVRKVNGAHPDLFLSIHTNGVDHSGPRGYEVWVPLPQDARGTASRDLATLIRSELGSVWDRSSEDRGTKDEHNLRVLKQTVCPAALVEMEFVSNPHAERLLASHDHRVKIATAIAEAAKKWIQKRR